jgi:hypothetical protein
MKVTRNLVTGKFERPKKRGRGAPSQCDARCTGAVKNLCVCQCGGKNHGAAYRSKF